MNDPSNDYHVIIPGVDYNKCILLSRNFLIQCASNFSRTEIADICEDFKTIEFCKGRFVVNG